MKTIVTIIFLLFIATAAQAQVDTTEVKVATISKTIVTQTTHKLNLESTIKVARLTKFKNTRILKALAFTTKANKPKMA
ncbi:hypothetical protein [Maribacter sp. 2210JD10-5]|uniref:hypothetical protein n=1 Tax=Maribacter sp. 2210JD10-5 TaxID=3386272 RepID=UPI0039BCB04F